MALIVAVESAHEPPQPARRSGEPDLLRKYFGLRVVVERRVQLVNRLWEVESAPGDTGGQRGRISHDQNVAPGVGADGCHAHLPESVLQLHIAEHELVGVGFWDLREQPTSTERHRRPRGGVRVC